MMKKYWRVLLATLLGALLPLSATATAATIDELLSTAEAVRSTDPKAFASALAQIDEVKEEATPAQLRQLRLLRAYQKIVTGKYDEAIKQAQAIYDEVPEGLRGKCVVSLDMGALIARAKYRGAADRQRCGNYSRLLSRAAVSRERTVNSRPCNRQGIAAPWVCSCLHPVQPVRPVCARPALCRTGA